MSSAHLTWFLLLHVLFYLYAVRRRRVGWPALPVLYPARVPPVSQLELLVGCP